MAESTWFADALATRPPVSIAAQRAPWRIPGSIATRSGSTIHSPKVFQAAEVAGLGTPTREYNKGTENTRFARTGTSITGIVLAVLTLAATLVPALFLGLLVDPLFLIMLLVVLMTLVLIANILGIGQSGGSLRFWSCPHGLVYMQGKHISPLRWEQLGLVYRKMAIVNGQVEIIGYFVQPIGAPAFQFTMLRACYALF